MTLIPYDCIFGPGTAFFLKGCLNGYHLDKPHSTEHYTYTLGVQNFWGVPGAENRDLAQKLINDWADAFRPFLDRLPEIEGKALDYMRSVGLPEHIELEGSDFVTMAGFGMPNQRSKAPVRISYYCGAHFDFGVTASFEVKPLFDQAFAKHAVDQAIHHAEVASLPVLTHKEFGKIERGDLVSLKRKKLGKRFVNFDLYLTKDQISKFSSDMLDPFIPLRNNLEGFLPSIIQALAPLRADWVENWLDPMNSDVSKPFHTAFPKAKQDGTISSEAFTKMLWLDRICFTPFGKSPEDSTPIATWDFRLLRSNQDDTIFVACTDAKGHIIEVTTET